MGLTILPPSPEPTDDFSTNHTSSTDDSDSDPPSDIDARPTKRARLSHHKSSQIAIPGEIVTEETQWMRGHGTFIPDSLGTAIHASLAGPLQKTNRLLTIPPMRARYIPSIGDLIVGRITSLGSSFWKVDISAPLQARLPLSSINLPGGILRRRTTTDELQMRSYFQEGDLLVAEVQSISANDAGNGASLHARSLRYGKLRNGIFLAVAGTGGGTGVVRSKRQSFTVAVSPALRAGGARGGSAGGTGGDVDVILGVNGYVWLSKHVATSEDEGTPGGKTGSGVNATVSISNLDDAVGQEIYSSQNDNIPESTRREIARVAECIKVLAEGGVQVDEGSVNRAYEAAVDFEMGVMTDEDGAGGMMSREARRRVLESVLQ